MNKGNRLLDDTGDSTRFEDAVSDKMARPVAPVKFASIFVLDSPAAWTACGFIVRALETLPNDLRHAAEAIAKRHSVSSAAEKGVIVLKDGTSIVLLGRTDSLDPKKYPVVGYALSLPDIAAPRAVTVHSALDIFLVPLNILSSVPFVPHPNGITCLDRISLRSTSHSAFGASLGSLVHSALSEPRKTETYPNGLKMGFWKVRTPLSTAENRGELLFEVIERTSKGADRTTPWGWIFVSSNIESSHKFVEARGRARKLKAAGGF